MGGIIMIHEISLITNHDILELLSLQLASYRVEAELTGFDEILPLNDGIASIREINENFLGFYVVNESKPVLVGAISYTREGGTVTICRLMVHPNYFRQGIARQLLATVIQNQEHLDASRFVVSTGATNLPALQLYRSLRFTERGARTMNPGITLITLERPAHI
jgi:ribosomal protein S18 acetylase RimI-like enzyme